MNRKLKFIKKSLLKLLKASKKQFYDENNNPITPEQYTDILCSMDLKDAQDYQKKFNLKKQMEMKK